MDKVQVSIRLPQELVDWIDAQVRGYGRKTDRTEQVRICIEHRRISKLPRIQREKLFAKLDAAATLGGDDGGKQHEEEGSE